MQKPILILSLVALVAACAHEEIAQNTDKDWEHGLDADLSTSIAPLGPIDSDQGAYNLIRRREKDDLHRDASQVQMPGNDKAVARVISFATNDRHRSAAAELTKDIDASAAGVLHEHQPRHAEFIHRPAIDFADCVAAQGLQHMLT